MTDGYYSDDVEELKRLLQTRDQWIVSSGNWDVFVKSLPKSQTAPPQAHVDADAAAYDAYRVLPASGHTDGFGPSVPALKHAFYAGIAHGRSAPAPQSNVRVMSLQWGRDEDRGPSVFIAKTPVGWYFVYKLTGFRYEASGPAGFEGRFKRIEAAQEAAQQHLRNLVASCLLCISAHPSPQPNVVGLAEALKTPFCVLFLDGRNEFGSHVQASYPRSFEVVGDDISEQSEAILEAAENAGFQIGQHVWAEFAWVAPQIGEEGRVELAGYWDFRWINEEMTRAVLSMEGK